MPLELQGHLGERYLLCYQLQPTAGGGSALLVYDPELR
jgi:hypothetical protein